MNTFEITLTDIAHKHLTAIYAHNNIYGFIVSVTNKGCGGFGYLLSMLDDGNRNDNLIINRDYGFELATDPISIQFVNGVEIDLHDDGFSKHLIFNNPNASNTCGCGESFSVDN